MDSAQYAAIAMEMVQTEEYLQVYEAGENYLDKPPLIFWLGALFFKIFGFTTFTFKLPALIGSCFALYYLYKLTTEFFDKNTAKTSVLVLASSLGYVWINSDVKTDVLVTNSILISAWFLIQFIKKNKALNLIFGGIFVGFAMLSKGPMGLVFPGVIVFLYLLQTDMRKQLLTPKILLFPLTVFLILLPMMWGLYHQYDLHPEEVVNGKTGVSGLRFFFWEQSFGRITGINEWKNDTSFFYLFHGLLLLIVPYSLILLYALYDWLKGIKNNLRKPISLFWLISIILLTALSLSSYKIPHYAAVVFPYCAVVIAVALHRLESDKPKLFQYHNYFMTAISLIFAVLSFYWFSPSIPVAFLILASVIISVVFNFGNKYKEGLIVTGISVGLVVFAHLLPGMVAYSAGIKLTEVVEEDKLENREIFYVNRDSRAAEFYLQKRFARLSWQETIDYPTKSGKLFYMETSAVDAFAGEGLVVKEKYCFTAYDINRISIKFLNPTSREKELQTHCLVEFAE